MNDDQKCWYAAPASLGQEEAVQAFRTRYGREPEIVEEPGDEEHGLWLLGPVTAAEAGCR